jgi:hypothetical protein
VHVILNSFVLNYFFSRKFAVDFSSQGALFLNASKNMEGDGAESKNRVNKDCEKNN